MNIIPDGLISNWTSIPDDIIDCHTHSRNADSNQRSMVCCSPDDNFEKYPAFSLAIHPWDVDEGWKDKLLILKQRIDALKASDSISRLKAIGETGIDKLRGGTMEQQIACFEAHLRLAKSLQKPVIIHCVKAYEQVLDVLARCKFSQPTIFHGFRGKPELAHRLLSKGFYLSFGQHFNPYSLRLAVSAHRCLIETDATGIDIFSVYQDVKRSLDKDVCR